MNNKENFKEKFLEIMSQTTETNKAKEAPVEEEPAPVETASKGGVMSDEDIQEMLKEKLKEKLQEKNMTQEEEDAAAEEQQAAATEQTAAPLEEAAPSSDHKMTPEEIAQLIQAQTQGNETDAATEEEAVEEPLTQGELEDASEADAGMETADVAGNEEPAVAAKEEEAIVASDEAVAMQDTLTAEVDNAAANENTMEADMAAEEAVTEMPMAEVTEMPEETAMAADAAQGLEVAEPAVEETATAEPAAIETPVAEPTSAVEAMLGMDPTEIAAEPLSQQNVASQQLSEVAIPIAGSQEQKSLKVPVKTEDALSEVSVITAETIISGQIVTKGHVHVDGEINGNLKAAGDVIVSGRVSGDIEGDNLELNECNILGNLAATGATKIGEKVVLRGDVVAQNLEISGSIEGNVVGVKDVQLSATAVIEGSLSTDRLAMNPGAKLKGMVNVGQ